MNKKPTAKTAFSFLEASMVMVIVGFLIMGISIGKNIVDSAKLTRARVLTQSSVVNGIKDLVFWVEATSTKSFATDDPDDLSSIAAWYDINPQLINKNAAIQATAGSQPTYVRKDINSLPAVRFDGTADYLTVTDNGALSLTTWTIFVVLKVKTNKNFNGIVIKGVDSLENYEILSFSDGSLNPLAKFTDGTRNGINTAANTIVNNVSNIFVFQFKNDAAYGMQFYQNGALNVQSQAATILKTPSTSTSDNLFIGSDTALASRYLDGDIGEVIIFGRFLTTFERQQVELYLSKKWGIALT